MELADRFRLTVWEGARDDASDTDLQDRYRWLADRGVRAVFLQTSQTPRILRAIRNAGMEVHAWMWTTNQPNDRLIADHPDWFMVSRSGKSCASEPPYVGYYRWLNPLHPEARAYIVNLARDRAANPEVDGVHLDYVRYPDVILPRGLWRHYGLDQTEELADYDFDYSDLTCEAFRAETGQDPRDLEHPELNGDWLRFRYRVITELVREIRDVVAPSGKPLTAAVFPTPRLARLICRQNWGEWPLDAAFPMLYHSFYEEPSTWVGDCTRENLQSTPVPTVAGLYLPAFGSPEELAATASLARRRGAVGIALFGDVTEEQLQSLRMPGP